MTEGAAGAGEASAGGSTGCGVFALAPGKNERRFHTSLLLVLGRKFPSSIAAVLATTSFAKDMDRQPDES